MLLLSGKGKPEDASSLRQRLNLAAQDFFRLSGEGPARIEGHLPKLDLVGIDISGARFELNKMPPRPGAERERAQLGVAERLELKGEPLRFSGGNVAPEAEIHLHIEGEQVGFDWVRDAEDQNWIAATSVGKGTGRLRTTARDLENIFLGGATAAAREHGVQVEYGKMTVQAAGDRGVSIVAEIQARKLFVKGTVAISGTMMLDHGFNARFSDLKCQGKGAIGTMAAGLVGPYLHRWEGRTLPLLGLFFSGLQADDLKIRVEPDGSLDAHVVLSGGEGKQPE